MRNIFLLTLAFAVTSCGDDPDFSSTCLPDNLQDGVLAFYPFNNGNLNDDTSYANNLTNNTSAASTNDKNGNPNCAFQFSNSQTNEEFITTVNTGFLNGLSDFSISMWYEPNDTTRDGGDYEVLISRGEDPDCGNENSEWAIALFDCRKAVFSHNGFAWANSITAFPIDCQDEVIAQTNKWHHVVATKAANEFKIYHNGVLQETVAGHKDCVEDKGDLHIGKDYKGKIDDILIYNRAVTSTEVTQLYELPTCCE